MIFRSIFFLSLFLPALVSAQDELAGKWSCYLVSPGGKLKFELSFESTENSKWNVFIHNGDEAIQIPSVVRDKEEILLEMDHYDSKLKFQMNDHQFAGTWRKRRGKAEWVEMLFRGNKIIPETSTTVSNSEKNSRKPDSDNSISRFNGKWLVDFEKSSDPSVANFSVAPSGVAKGTFMTTTGDYRFLFGDVKNGTLELSCFDGAHAFLFRAVTGKEGKLEGDFWSTNTWHEKWTANRNPTARLPDAFTQTKLVENQELGKFKFPNLDGEAISLNDPRFQAKSRLIYVFGSWCPNCHDAAAYFKELQAKYSSKDLSILGLAFEHTGDFERDSEQVRKYLSRNEVEYPVLIAGLSDKKLASKSIPFLDRVRSYPTTVFLDGTNNQVRAIHTGFTGPATGDSYRQLKEKFEGIIDSIISQK